MSPSDPSKIECLVRYHFPWGQNGCPVMPLDSSPTSLLNSAKAWIDGRLRELGFGAAATTLHARIQKVLDDVQTALPRREESRLFSRPDLTHLVKSADSVMDKMVRDWNPSVAKGPDIGFDDFHIRMEDLARFRVVLNFLSDVEEACRKLEEPYLCRPDELDRLSEAQRLLRDEFALRDHKFHNLIQLLPEKRESGERCRKAIFHPRNAPQTKVEVQVQTMLQEAWDKKDHFLVYEPKRRGEKIHPDHQSEIYAMSELLYVADLTFDRLRAAIRGCREGTA
jgi:ppGpp synthetase/RelA/SpoT-type nucleotidyltranferase